MSTRFPKIDDINIPPQIRELIGGRGFDWLPQFGRKFVGTPGAEVRFDIPYIRPPIVVATCQMVADPKTESPLFEIPEIKVSIPKIQLDLLPKFRIDFPAITKPTIDFGQFQLPEISKIDIPDISMIAKTIEFNLKETLAKVQKTIKSKLVFPYPPKIDAWKVSWHKMTAPGVYGEALVEVQGDVFKDPSSLPSDGISSISSGAGELPTITGSFQVATSGTGNAAPFTDEDLASATERIISSGKLRVTATQDGSVVVNPTDTNIATLGSMSPFDNFSSENPLFPQTEQDMALTSHTAKSKVMALRRINVTHKELAREGKSLSSVLSTETPQTIPTEKIEDGTTFDRQAGEFTGMFNFDFGEDGVFAGASKHIGFRSQAQVEVEQDTKLFILALGSEGYRVWLNSVIVIDDWTVKTLPTTQIVSVDLAKGTYIISFDWWNWESKLPSVAIQTMPPLIPREIGKVQFDLENALELANLNAWYFIRDSINTIYDDFLPVWEIKLPEVIFPQMKLTDAKQFVVSVPKIEVAGKTIYEGKTWTLNIPALTINKFKLLTASVLTLDVAAPFIAANNGLFGFLNILPRWFGRFQGREIGKHITAMANAIGGVIQGAYDFVTSSVKGINDYTNAQLEGLEENIEKTIDALTGSVNQAIGETVNSLKESSQKVVNEAFGEIVQKTNEISKVVGTGVETAMNLFKDELGVALESSVREIVTKIETGIENAIDEASANIKKSIEPVLNDTITQLTSAMDKKIDSGLEMQRAVMETHFQDTMAVFTRRINGTLSQIVPQVMRSVGIPEGVGLTQVTPYEITGIGFKLPGNLHGQEVNWIAIGTPMLDKISSKAVEIMDF